MNATGKIERLGTLLDSANELVTELLADPLLARLVRVFTRMPMEDREVILQVLEREVNVRLASRNGGSAVTGIGTAVNRNARLYVRVLERTPVDMSTDHDQLVYANLRVAGILRMLLLPEFHGPWRAAALEAFGLLDAESRRAVATVAREALGLIAVVDTNAAAEAEAAG